ncbi:MAG: DNA polymerase III subunit delta [Phycisphaerales bacterium]|nr:MAG: DNA polymerase III subunit delta [Phycisphaerales bacterium]
MAKRPANPSRMPDASCRIVVLHGPDAFLRAEHSAALVRVLEQSHGAVDVLHFAGGSSEAADVLDECRSFGLMATHKVVMVDDADQLIKEESRERFERYAAKPSEGATLVLRSSRWHKGKLDGLIEAVGVLVKCEAPGEAQAVAWAIKRCAKRHGGVLTREAAELLVERVGVDLGRLHSELGKLAAAAGLSPCGDAVPIDRALVAEFVGVSREESAFAIQDAVARRSAPEALTNLRDAVERSRESPVLVSWACMDVARKLHALACAGRGATELAQAMRIWPADRQRALVQQAGRLGPAKTLAMLEAAVAGDHAQKSGLGRDPMRTLERLAVTLTS